MRDKAEFGDADFITFTVYRTAKDNTAVCGCHDYNYQSAELSATFVRPLPAIPVGQAFDIAYRFAKSSGIAAIWINDPDHLFDPEQSW